MAKIPFNVVLFSSVAFASFSLRVVNLGKNRLVRMLFHEKVLLNMSFDTRL